MEKLSSDIAQACAKSPTIFKSLSYLMRPLNMWPHIWLDDVSEAKIGISVLASADEATTIASPYFSCSAKDREDNKIEVSRNKKTVQNLRQSKR